MVGRQWRCRCRQPPSRRAQHRRRRRRRRQSTTTATRTNESHGYKDVGGGRATPPPEHRRLSFSSRFVSPLRSSTRLLAHNDGSSYRRAILSSSLSLSSFLPSFFLCRGAEPRESNVIPHRRPNNAAQTRARHRGERQSQYQHLTYTSLGATSGRRDRVRKTAKGIGRKKAEKRPRLPLSHARALRHLDTSDTSSLSPLPSSSPP